MPFSGIIHHVLKFVWLTVTSDNNWDNKHVITCC